MSKRTKKIGIGLGVLVIAALGFFSYKNRGSQTNYVTAAVTKGNLTQTVDATGEVESAHKINLNFKTAGRVEEMRVDVGDPVKVGQTLATLEAGALKSRVTDAQGQLQQAQANLDKVKAGASALDIKVSESTVQEKNAALESRQNDLDNLMSKRETELKNLKSTLVVTLNNEVVVADGSMETVNNTMNDSDARDTLGTGDQQGLIDAINDQTAAETAVAGSELEIFGLETTMTDDKVVSAAENLVAVLDMVKVSLQDTLNVLEHTAVSYNLTETELDTLKTNIKAEQAKNNISRTNVNSALTNLLNKKASYTELVRSAEDAVKSAEQSLAVAQAQLDFKKAPPRDFDVRLYEAQVKQAQANLSLALANLSDTVIKAPVEGIVTKVNFKTGEQTSLAANVIEMISEANFEIKVDIPESDIAKVNVGQKAEITLDAFGDERVFAGKVTFVEPAETNIQDVVYYKVTVQFSDKDQVKSGMTANLTIITAAKENALIVPIRAVKQKNGRKYVEVLDSNNALSEKDVATGLKGDEGMEILSGVQEGEKVVLGENGGKK